MRTNNKKETKVVSFGSLRNPLKSVHIFFLAAFLFLSFPLSDVHSQVTLAWDASTASDVVGYKVFYGTSSGSYLSSVNAGKVLTYSISGLKSGLTYYFAVTAQNISGSQSGYSNEVSFSIPAAACAYTIAPTSQSISSGGGTGTVSVTTPSECTWTAVSNASWIVLTSNSSGTSAATVNYSVAANPATTSRSGTMTIAGKVVTVTQSGVSSSKFYNRRHKR